MGKPNLSQGDAIKRFGLFAETPNIKYELIILFRDRAETDDQPYFTGLVNMSFDLISISSDLFLDFKCEIENIKKLSINDQDIEITEECYKCDDHKLYLAPESLKIGSNVVSIKYVAFFSYFEGFYYTEASDGEFIYSLFEPYKALEMFPCFDQPDLKAKLKLFLIVDKTWAAISNEKIISSSPSLPERFAADFQMNENEIICEFKETPLLPTYLFEVAAGNYVRIKCEDNYRDIEMSLYMRPRYQIRGNKVSAMIFKLTKDCLQFYEDFCQTKYPFEKCDLIFAPNHQAGAMETPGALSFSENNIDNFLSDPNDLTHAIYLLFHELAHQWFGNLVTLKWWDGIWLNEALAEFAGFLAQEKIEPEGLKTGKKYLCMRKAGSAYVSDNDPSVHPVRFTVKNTVEAEKLFGEYFSIIYTKGACAVRQLYLIVGHERFSKALKFYFEKFAWKNITHEDFLETFREFIPEGLGYSIDDWERDWLDSPGLSQLFAFWNADQKESNSSVKIIQKSDPNFPNARRKLFLKVAFLSEKGDVIEIKDKIINRDVTYIEYDGRRQPKIVFLNYENEGYCEVDFDYVSRHYLNNDLVEIIEPCSQRIAQDQINKTPRNLRDLISETADSETGVSLLLEMISIKLNVGSMSSIIERLSLIIAEEKNKLLKGLIKFKAFQKFYWIACKMKNRFDDRIGYLVDGMIMSHESEEHKQILIDWLSGQEPLLGSLELSKSNQDKILKML